MKPASTVIASLGRRAASVLALVLVLIYSGFASSHGRPHDLLILDLGADNNQLTVHVDAPLDSLLGFAKSPSSSVQKEAAAAFLQEMKRADWLFDLPKSTQCTLRNSRLDVPNLGVLDESPNQTLDGKLTKRLQEDHGTFMVTYEWHCASMKALQAIPLQVFNRFKSINTVTVRVASAKSQFTADIKRNQGSSTILLNR